MAEQAVPQHDKRQRVLDSLAQMRNENTVAAYSSGWKQFQRWCESREGEVDIEHPDDLDLAEYVDYMVKTKNATMSSVNGAISAISDHFRFEVTAEWNPCTGPYLKQMRAALVTSAKQSQQKKEITWEQMEVMIGLIEGEGSRIAQRDGCMILLAYYGYLRASEVARMDRTDIQFLTIEGKQIMQIHVNRLCKNDSARIGHDRIIERREAGICVVQMMEHFLVGGAEDGEALFNTEGMHPKRVSSDTPRTRLKHWLGAIGVEDVDRYGFHSVRAGAATESARGGVAESKIKLHGNWKSDAVRLYMRAGVEERLEASAALGGQKRKQQEAPEEQRQEKKNTRQKKGKKPKKA
jgi:integrase